MKPPLKTLFAISAVLTWTLSARAEVIVTVDHNEETPAAGAFHFKSVPSPHPSAALGATFKVVEGEVDDNSGTLEVLHDGKLPDEEDEPSSNFFFQEDTDGGRILMDLGKATAIKEVDTYSWHRSTRAPQVYKVYGSDGSGAGFVAEPKRPQDPTHSGWKLIAAVDTRTRFGNAAGQYGVSIADTAEPLGSYRYLLFDVTRTEEEDTYGNTFFSEIDVAEAVWMGVAVEPASKVLQAQLSLAADSGLVVSEVLADSPAAKAGLQANDVLTRFNDQVLVSPTQLVTLVGAQRAGDTVRVAYVRHAQAATAEVKVDTYKHPADKGAPAAPAAPAAQGKVAVTVDHNEGEAATSAFKFKTVPSPRPTAALKASFTTNEDNVNGSPDLLHDGTLPTEEDEPDANFFFQDDSEGGTVTVDLGKVISIKEVDTYSWHTSTRAPQVYKLYGREADDAKSEWKLIAEVDTRTKFQDAGGQYGVKVDAGDGIVGRYRYLRFDMVRTEKDDSWGNTFYSEIDVVDSDAPAKK